MRILVIDDEESIRYSLNYILSKIDGVEVFTAETGEKGLDILRTKKIDLAIVDIKLPGIDGIEVLNQINRFKFNTVVVMITYMSEVSLAVKAMKMGAYDYYTKPFSLEEIKETVKEVMEFVKVKGDIDLKDDISDKEFIGCSKESANIKNVIEKVGEKAKGMNILIIGESGVGKEIVARSIHRTMHADAPFVPLNCAAIPKTLQESELFGYEKGAFSDAHKSKQGLFELADGGTLFLDEIGDMDLSLQAKLLRVLQDRKFRRVGSNEEISFSTTVLSATNKNLNHEMKSDNFREDLYYRINDFLVEIPPLRDRKSDIPLLVDHFIYYYKDKIPSKVTGISPEALEVMMNYEWRGNVRELKSIIARILILTESNRIEISDIPADIFFDNSECETGLEAAEKEAILQSLLKNGYNITKTAAELGITRTTLRNKIKRYEIQKKDI